MENRYKIILSGNQIYKEAELPADMERVTVGTGIDCTVRLRRDLFFESIQIEFVKESGGWRATCSDNIYFTEGDIRKYMTRKVIHGDTLEVRYQESEGLVFRIDFQIDFDSGSHRCERMINLDRYQTISIGNNSAYEIALSGVYAKREFVRLTRGQGGWTLEVMNSEYGVYHNGKKTEQKEWIKDGDFFSVADYYFFLKGNALWAEIRSDLTVNGLGFGDYPERNGYPRFSRNTRLKTVICEDKIEISDPPSKPQKPKSNLFMKLFPSFGMLIAAGAMAFMGGTMIIFSLISCTIAIITAVSSFVAYKEAGRTDMKQIVLIIDNLTALKELYFQDDDELLNLCREGITVGISIVIANAQTAGIGYKYLSSFSNRIALFCNDGNEYSAIFEHCNRRLEHLPGRCFAEVDKQILECQAYLPFAGEKEFERAEAIRGYIEKRNGECTEVARKIPLIPPVLSMNYMAQQFGNMMRGHFDLAAGLNYEDVMPYMLRMSSIGVLAVVGREGSGRYNWIKYVADMLELMYPGRSKVYISDGIGKKLASMKEKRNVVRYSMIAEDIVSYLKEIEEELQSRYELLAKGIESDPAEADYMLLIIDNPDAIEQISNSKEALASYKNIIGRYRNMNVGVIISAIENAPIPYSAPEVIKGIRDGRHLMYFGDISELKIYDMPLAVTRKFKKPIETGDGYYIKENECIKLKTPFIAGE